MYLDLLMLSENKYVQLHMTDLQTEECQPVSALGGANLNWGKDRDHNVVSQVDGVAVRSQWPVASVNPKHETS